MSKKNLFLKCFLYLISHRWLFKKLKYNYFNRFKLWINIICFVYIIKLVSIQENLIIIYKIFKRII